MENELRELLEQKRFDELSLEEQQLVLGKMTEQEYQLRQKTLVDSRAVFRNEAASLQARDSIRVAALEALRGKQKSKPARVMFLNYKIPAWSAVAAVFVVLLSVYSIEKFNGNAVKSKDVIQISEADTVYVERVVRDTLIKTIVKEQVVSKANTSQNSVTTYVISNPKNDVGSAVVIPNRMELGGMDVTFDTNKRNYGKSLDEDVLSQKVLMVGL